MSLCFILQFYITVLLLTYCDQVHTHTCAQFLKAPYPFTFDLVWDKDKCYVYVWENYNLMARQIFSFLMNVQNYEKVNVQILYV